MKTFKEHLMEVQQPLSQGEKNFYAMHKPEPVNLVPGITDQDHIFKGNPRRDDPKTASYEIKKSEDESLSAYDKNLKVEEVESVEEAKDDNQYIEVTNKFTGRKSHTEVHPSKAFAALNRYKSLWNTGSARIVSGKEAEKVKSSVKKEEVEVVDEASLASLAPPKDKVTKKDVLVGRGVLKKHHSNPDKHVVAKEEVESVDEVLDTSASKAKYLMKAKNQLAAAGILTGSKSAKGEPSAWADTFKKRNKGLDMLSNKMAKEDVNLDEKTLTPAELKKREEVAKAMERENPGMDKSKKMAIATATAKRVAEEAEQVEEGKYNWDKEHKRGLTDTQGNRMLKKKALPSQGPSKDELRKLASKSTHIGKVVEAALSAKQKKIAGLNPPKDKIDGGDLAALRRGEHKK